MKIERAESRHKRVGQAASKAGASVGEHQSLPSSGTPPNCMHLTGLGITLVFKDVQPLRHRMLVLHLEVPEGCPGGNSAPEHIPEDLFMPTEDMTLS